MREAGPAADIWQRKQLDKWRVAGLAQSSACMLFCSRSVRSLFSRPFGRNFGLWVSTARSDEARSMRLRGRGETVLGGNVGLRAVGCRVTR